MTTMTSDEEKKYKIVEHTTTEKMVNAAEYSEVLRSKLNYAFEDACDLSLKIKKLTEEYNSKKDLMTKITNDLIQLNGEEQTKKDLEYSKWRFCELYPKKARILYPES